MSDRLDDIKAALACQPCGDTGSVTEVLPEHDPNCDGSCRNCPVAVPYQAPCPNCNDGDAPSPLSWEQSRRLVAEVERARVQSAQADQAVIAVGANIKRLTADMTALRLRHAEAGAATTAPIPLTEEQEREAKEWAADDRLWTTRETVEFNLRTFARKILSLCPPALARQRHAEAEKAGRFCYLEGWNDVVHDREADFNRAWAAWIASSAKAALEGDHEL